LPPLLTDWGGVSSSPAFPFWNRSCKPPGRAVVRLLTAIRPAFQGSVLENGRVMLTGSGRVLAGDRRVRDASRGEG